MRPGLDPGRGVCGISVAADLAGMGVQTLRLDEARGLLHPTAQTAEPAATPTNLDRLLQPGRPGSRRDLPPTSLTLACLDLAVHLAGSTAALGERGDPQSRAVRGPGRYAPGG